MVMFTNVNRVTGLSGIDTESMIAQIMRAESTRLDRLHRRSGVIQWQQQAYRNTANQLNIFQREFLDILGPNSIRSSTNMNSHSASVTGGSGVNATATGSARPGSHTVRVDQLATAAQHSTNNRFTGSIQFGENFDPSSLTEGDSFRISLNGTARDISFTQDELDEIGGDRDAFVGVLNRKLEAEFGSTGGNQRVQASVGNNGRIEINSHAPGNRVVITEGTGRPSQVGGGENDSLNEDQFNNLASLRGDQTLTVNGQEVTVNFGEADDDDLTAAQIVSRVNAALRDSDHPGTSNVQLSSSTDEDGNVTFTFRGSNSNEDIQIGGPLADALGTGGGTLDRTNTLGVLGVNNGAENRLDSNHSLEDIFGNLNWTENEDGARTTTITMNGREIELDASWDITRMQSAINNSGAGVTLSYNSLNGEFSLASNTEGERGQIEFGDDAGTTAFLGSLGFSRNADAGTGTDALVNINGQDLQLESNTFTHEGIRFEFTEETAPGEEVTVTVGNDTARTREIIEGFVEAYNALIEELNSLRTTSRPRTNSGGHFDPLTDEERREMSAEEIRLWEEQGQTGMLHRSEILDRVTSDMRRQLNEPITLSDGTVMRLSDFGITTSSDFTERGRLVINEDRLEEALQTIPGNDVAAAFGELGNRINDSINSATSAIRSRAGAETGVASTQNSMQSRIDRYGDRMRVMERQLERMEMRLFAQFSRMENAVMQSNSQMDFLFSMMGM